MPTNFKPTYKGERIVYSSVTKHISFDAAHYLMNPAWDRETNMAKFHKCCLYKKDGSDQPHGHTYHLEVTVFGIVDPDTGFVIDFKDLKKILSEGVLEKLDHNLLNTIDFFKVNLATAENICQYIWQEIVDEIEAVRPEQIMVTQIKLYETPDSFALLTRDMVIGAQPRIRTCGGNCGNCKDGGH